MYFWYCCKWLPWWLSGKDSACNKMWVRPLGVEVPLEKEVVNHSSILAWEIPWTENLVGCSPWDREESDMTEQLHSHFSLSGIGEGNGNPLQCSCLENPRDGGAWWAAVYGVAQSRTRLKRLSSSIHCERIPLIKLIICLSPHTYTFFCVRMFKFSSLRKLQLYGIHCSNHNIQ